MWGDVDRQTGNTEDLVQITISNFISSSSSALPCPRSCLCVWYPASIQGSYVLPPCPWSNDCSRFLLLLLLSYFFVRYNHASTKPLWYVSALILKATKCTPIPIRLFDSCFWTVSKKTQVYLPRSNYRHTLRWPSMCKYPYTVPSSLVWLEPVTCFYPIKKKRKTKIFADVVKVTH